MDDGNALYAVRTRLEGLWTHAVAWATQPVTAAWLIDLAAWLGQPVSPFLPTVSWSELIYGVPIFAAWVLGLWMLLDVQRDLRALRRSGRNGQLLVMKQAAVRRERLQVAGLTGWIIAIVPLLMDSRIRLVTFVLGALIYAWCKAANAVIERRYRIRQERFYERLSALAATVPPRVAAFAPRADPAPTTLAAPSDRDPDGEEYGA